MKAQKKAFTLTEVLIVMLIIGFILTVQLIVLTGKINQYGAPYYTAYSAIKKTGYNILADIHCPECYTTGGRVPQCQENKDYNCKDYPRNFPTNKDELCSRFTEFINAAETNCSQDAISDATTITKTTPPHIIATNGFRFYFSGIKTHSTGTQFFIVYIDLNGGSEPNRVTCNSSDVLPDIVPFALTTRGEIIPIGYPKYSKVYLTSTVKIPDGKSSQGEETKMLSFYEAALGAWPNSSGDEVEVKESVIVPMSLNFDSFVDNTCYDDSNSKLSLSEIKSDARDARSGIANKLQYCEGGTYNCRVVVNKYQTSRF